MLSASKVSLSFVLALTLSAQNQTAGLHRLFASEWDYDMEQSPMRASFQGDLRWNDRWPDLSLAAIERRHQHDTAVLTRLHAFDRAKLSIADQLNYDLFEQSYQRRIEEHGFHWYFIPLNQREGIQAFNPNQLPFSTSKHYVDWMAPMMLFPAYLDQTIALMKEGIRARILEPKIVMERIPAQIDAQIPADPTQSPFYKPFLKFPNSMPAHERELLSAAAKQTIELQVIPAYRRLKQFFVTEYLPASFDHVGVWQVPNGDALYAHLVRLHTTTNLTPAQIHEIGLHEVARIRDEMETVMAKAGFRGTRAEFFNFLRTDPRFYYKTPDELLNAYRAFAKRIDPNLVKVFRILPRTPYGVEPIPAAIAPDTTTAYYSQPAGDGSRAGTYFVNLYRPETRPIWEMTALSLHEAVPGHHIQIALAMELGDVPNFRRFEHFTAFTEGWGLYAESLGEEMGLYDDPYAKFGQLTYQMWRAVRLVVDTGIHSMHWDRQKAVDYFMENAPKTELDVTNEVDRYIAWPGQALAYKIGELKIKELRAKSQAALGAKFDLREFHNIVLGSGGIPLDILERNVDAWIAKQKY
ncbi:MAG: DUF885 domain-containing protein [Acidobacteriota bacterium]|nr:DUF885 domain-containing protein [Acidobacteriota bacterium]